MRHGEKLIEKERDTERERDHFHICRNKHTYITAFPKYAMRHRHEGEIYLDKSQQDFKSSETAINKAITTLDAKIKKAQDDLKKQEEKRVEKELKEGSQKKKKVKKGFGEDDIAETDPEVIKQVGALTGEWHATVYDGIPAEEYNPLGEGEQDTPSIYRFKSFSLKKFLQSKVHAKALETQIEEFTSVFETSLPEDGSGKRANFAVTSVRPENAGEDTDKKNVAAGALLDALGKMAHGLDTNDKCFEIEYEELRTWVEANVTKPDAEKELEKQLANVSISGHSKGFVYQGIDLNACATLRLQCVGTKLIAGILPDKVKKITKDSEKPVKTLMDAVQFLLNITAEDALDNDDLRCAGFFVMVLKPGDVMYLPPGFILVDKAIATHSYNFRVSLPLMTDLTFKSYRMIVTALGARSHFIMNGVEALLAKKQTRIAVLKLVCFSVRVFSRLPFSTSGLLSETRDCEGNPSKVVLKLF